MAIISILVVPLRVVEKKFKPYDTRLFNFSPRTKGTLPKSGIINLLARHMGGNLLKPTKPV
jgi:hypothetical protein